MAKKNTPTQPPSGGSRRDSLRRQRLAEQQAARRRTVAVRVGIAVVAATVLVAVVAGIAVTIGASKSPTPGTATAQTSATAPAAVDASGAILLGDASAPTTVTVYTDFICPYCGKFDRTNADVLSAAIASGAVKLQVYPLNFLDDASNGTKYSTRAANAFATVANSDPDHALAFYQSLFENQPDENATGLSDQQIADLATTAGVPADVVATFADQTFVPWVDEMTTNQLTVISGTPTILINGTQFDGDPYTAGPFEAALQAASQG